MKVRRLVALCTAMFLSLQMAELPASAAGRFSDVPAGSPFYESVTYLAECGITAGTGGHSFSPERPITVREWAALLFRAFDGSTLSCDSPKERSELSIQRCYQNGWLGVSAAISPDRTLCRGELLLSAFRAAGLPVYDASLYGYEETGMSPQENAVRIGEELGLCPEGAAPLECMTRGDAAMLLFPLLTQSIEIAAPPILDVVPIHADASTDLNRYLLEIACVPESILQAFHDAGWEYHVSPDYLRSYSEEHGMNCIGLTSYSEKRIYVSTPSSTIHEFGHFLEWVLRFPPEYEMLYREEAEAALAVLREYAATNSHEYFADYFAFWIRNSADEARMERLKTAAPQTYEYFSALEACNWVVE